MPAVDSFVGEGLNPSPYKEMLSQYEAASAILARTTRERDEALAKCDRLRAEREALRADAERYRWLRDHMGHYDVDADYDVEGHNVPALAQVSDRIWYHATDCMDDTLDAAIDAARGSE